jgi:SAM-dependent methyltransferase
MAQSIDLMSAHNDAGRVAKTIEGSLDQISSAGLVSRERIAFLSDCFAQAECPWIDYDKCAHEFAFEYFLQNFWKSYLAFVGHQPRVALRVLDIGCGSGATSIAYLTYLNSYIQRHCGRESQNPPLLIEVVLVDRSEKQLQLSRKFITQIAEDLPNLNIRSSYIRKDISSEGLSVEEGRYDLVLYGHVLTENRRNVKNILRNGIEVAEEDGRIYAIERETDSVWKEIEVAIEAMALERNIASTAPLLSPFISSDSLTAANDHNLRTNYLVARLPQRNELRTLLMLYFQAWKYQDESLLQDIFTPNATYSEKPFSAPLAGLPQIQRYWSEKVLRQRAISIELGHVCYTADEAVAEWRARFSVDRGSVDVRGMLILTFDKYTGRINSLREYFRTQHA